MKIFELQWFKGWISMARPQPIFLAQRAAFFALLLLLGNAQNAKAQVVINEILPNGSVELKNTGSSMANVGSYWLCNFPAYQQITNANLECGSIMMAPGSLLTVNNFPSFNGADGEMGIYTTNSFSDPAAMIDYVEWGSTGHQRSSVAVAAMIWSTGDFVSAFTAGSSLEYSGTGDAPSSWTEQATPTICAENGGGSPPCTAEGGVIAGGPFEFCVGDGIEDNVSDITLTENEGTNSQWVVTDDLGNILGLPPTPEAVDFDGAGPGNCLIWHLSFEDGLGGAEVGNNASELTGCFSLSNPITVVRNQPNGGTLEGGPFEFCVGDGVEDNVSDITLTGNTGTNSQWVVTDDLGNILGLPPTPEAVDFDGAGPGNCLIWHLSFEDGLGGAEVGNNASELTGCFSLSNPITVVRNQPNGGTLEGGPFEFCVGDGIEDNVSDITLTENEGTNSQWVVTDDLGNILGLPPSPEAVDFDGAGPGNCLIWHLSFEDGLGGAEVGNNASELTGCFNLSNPITVVRLSGTDCNNGEGDNDYVLIGLDELDIERNFINLGGIGVVSDSGDAEISEDSEVTADGTFVRADEACFNSGAMANNVHAVPAQPNLPDFMENNNNVGNDLQVTVSAGETVTLTESIYEDIRVREGATVIFSGQENVYIEDLKTDEGVTFMFGQCTNLILSGRFELGYDNQFNPGEQNVFVFAEDDASIRSGSTVYGVVYTEKDLNIRKGTVDRQTYLYGIFIGDDVRSRDYANYWYQQFDQCGTNIIDPTNGAQNRKEAVVETTEAAAVQLSIFPNPANDVATISINKATQGDVEVAIYSATNQLVSTNMKISNDQGEISLNVTQLPAGIYFVKAMLENGEVITEKLIVGGKK